MKTLLISILLFALPAGAKSFSTSFIQFEIPENWSCELKNAAWVCRHQISAACLKSALTPECKTQIKKSREAIIIFAAKEVSAIDTMDAYQNALREPRKLTKKDSKSTTQSQVVHSKIVKIKQVPWVDGMQLSSELPNYYTRYLATIKGKIAVLVTFSAHKLYYTNYSNEFFKSIKSLNITSASIEKIDKKELGNKVLSRPIDIPNDLFEGVEEPAVEPANDSSSQFLFLGAIILAAIGILVWLRRSKD